MRYEKKLKETRNKKKNGEGQKHNERPKYNK